jgi:hypothetical protein
LLECGDPPEIDARWADPARQRDPVVRSAQRGGDGVERQGDRDRVNVELARQDIDPRACPARGVSCPQQRGAERYEGICRFGQRSGAGAIVRLRMRWHGVSQRPSAPVDTGQLAKAISAASMIDPPGFGEFRTDTAAAL